MFRRFAAAFSAIVSRWQEPYVWIPLSLFAAAAVYQIVRAIDPYAGTDGLGVIAAAFAQVPGVFLASFITWLITKTYFLDWRDADERELVDHGCGIDRNPETKKRTGSGPQSWTAVAVYIWNQVIWLAIFWLLLRVFVG